MEFGFSVNKFFPNTINKLLSQDVIQGQPELRIVLDAVGEASQIAQNLRRPVTTANSFINSDHTLYIMTNPLANNGRGAVIGLLKIGRKKLFLLNQQGIQNELYPKCILDFYIHESCQRMGFGKILFNYLLETEKLNVMALAIDRPSDKFLGFLHKHYGLVNTIPQVNNFVIFEGFFSLEENWKAMKNDQNSNLLPNRWSSTTSINKIADSYREHQSQATLSCLFSDAKCQDELWKRNSHVDLRRNFQPPVQVQGKSIQTETPSRFSHHRLW